jgi:hypothetical protein
MFHVHTNICIIPVSKLKNTVRTARFTVPLTGPPVICFICSYVTFQSIIFGMIDCFYLGRNNCSVVGTQHIYGFLCTNVYEWKTGRPLSLANSPLSGAFYCYSFSVTVFMVLIHRCSM